MNIDTSFLITSFIVVLIPGTGALYTISTGLSQGRRASLWAALGCTLGIVPHLLATGFGIAAILHASALIFQMIKYAGVAYLLYLAISTIRDNRLIGNKNEVEPRNGIKIITKAILINLLNPKLTIFFLAFLPQFIKTDGSSYIIQLSLLSMIFMTITFLVFALYGILANLFRSLVIDSPNVQKWMNRVVAGTFASMGIKLAFSD